MLSHRLVPATGTDGVPGAKAASSATTPETVDVSTVVLEALVSVPAVLLLSSVSFASSTLAGEREDETAEGGENATVAVE